jgi:ribosomal protein S18 acetylase RimI-like enzyme
MSTLIVRQATTSDYPYITDSFWRTYLRESSYARGSRPKQLIRTIETLIARHDWHVSVLCFDDLADEIIGWVLWRSPTEIGWIDVKGSYRGQGLAKRLLDHVGVERGNVACAFLTRKATMAAQRRGFVLWFRPYLAFPDEEEDKIAA